MLINLCIAVYLVVIVIVCYFFPLKGTIEPGDIHLIKFTPGFISTFPVQVFAFTCAQNVGDSPRFRCNLTTVIIALPDLQ